MNENFTENIPSNPYYDNSRDFYGDDIEIQGYMDLEEIIFNISKWLDNESINQVQYVLNTEEDEYLKYSKIFDLIMDNYDEQKFEDLTNESIEDVINYIAYELTTDLYVERKNVIVKGLITDYKIFKESLNESIERNLTADEIEYFTYLNDLRDSGVTNMFGAGEYLIHEYGLDKNEASRVLSLWMKYFRKDGNYESLIIVENKTDDEDEYKYEPEEHEDDSERRPDIQMNNLGWKNTTKED